jgi:hypothetical protein
MGAMTVQESQTNAVSPKPLRRNRLRAVFCALNFAVMVPLLLGLTLWAAAALYFDVRVPWLRLPLASVYVLGLLAIRSRVDRGRLCPRARLVVHPSTLPRS